MTSPDIGGGSRSSRLLGGHGTAGRGVLLSVVSTLVVLGVLGYLIVRSAGWPRVQAAFFDPVVFAKSLPFILRAFLINIGIFLIAEVFVLALALLIAIMRSLPGPAFTPFRIMAVDLHRPVPGRARDPGGVPARLRRSRAQDGGDTAGRLHLGHPCPGADLFRLRERSLSSRHRVRSTPARMRPRGPWACHGSHHSVTWSSPRRCGE